jgi:hypothetical protein
MQIDKSLPPVKPIFDTWGRKDGDEFAWSSKFRVNFTSASDIEINAWYADAVVKTLSSFSNFARVWDVAFSLKNLSPDNAVLISIPKWQPDFPYDSYIDQMLAAIRACPKQLISFEMKADIYVYTHTSDSPSYPVRGWIRNFADFWFSVYPDKNLAAIALSTKATLFCQSFFRYEDNTELYELNTPLLNEALTQWETHFGKLDIEGM